MTPKKKDPIEKVLLKDYSKIIFFAPLWVYSLIAMLVQGYGADRPGLAIVWLFIFFLNAVVIGFNFPTMKFLILFLVLGISVTVLALLNTKGIINLFEWWAAIDQFFYITLPARFYGWIVLLLGILILFAAIKAQLTYVKVEKNEIYLRGITAGKLDRYPTTGIRIELKIEDVFELISLGAGAITIGIDKDTSIHLRTVPRVRKAKRDIDALLSTTAVEHKD
jgi:hypothetical protein